MPVEIAIPFRIGGDGRVATTSDSSSQVRQHVFALVNTSPTERAMVPGYGMDLTPLLFEGMDNEEVIAEANTLVSNAFNVWEPGVGLASVSYIEDAADEQVILDVQYTRRDAADSGTAVNVNTAIIGANGLVREVVRG